MRRCERGDGILDSLMMELVDVVLGRGKQVSDRINKVRTSGLESSKTDEESVTTFRGSSDRTVSK